MFCKAHGIMFHMGILNWHIGQCIVMLQYAGRYLIETQPILDQYSAEKQPVSWSISDCYI